MKKVDQINLLEAFTALGFAENLQGASKNLQISRSALLRRITSLERSLGIQLFNRNKRGSKLTEEGYIVFLKSIQALEEYRFATSPCTFNSEDPEFLHISAPYSIGITLLLPWINRYRKIHRSFKVDLDLTLGPQKKLPAICDIRFSHSLITSERVKEYPLGGMPRVLVASQDYLFKFGMPKDPKQLQFHSLLGSQDLPSDTTFLLRKGKEIVRLPFHPTIRLRDHTSAKRAAIAGLGIGVHVLLHDIVKELADGSLIEILPGWSPEPCPVSMLLPFSHPVKKTTRTFMSFIKNCWKENQFLIKPQEIR